MQAYFPVSQVTDGQGLNIRVLSYGGGLHIGVLADRDLVPDVGYLMDGLIAELDALLELV